MYSMKLEKKQIVILVSGVVVMLILASGAWFLLSTRMNTAVLPKQTSLKSVVGTIGDNGTGNPAHALATGQAPVVATMDTPIADVKSKAEAANAIGDLDTLVYSAGNDME
jgi:hypothetical protein